MSHRSLTLSMAPLAGRRTAVGALIAPLALWLLASAVGAEVEARTVLVTQVDGVITPVMADHIEEGVARAEEEVHHVFLIELDTPGGLDASMRDTGAGRMQVGNARLPRREA
jgi:membrane-bound serine protease (ClpP class)